MRSPWLAALTVLTVAACEHLGPPAPPSPPAPLSDTTPRGRVVKAGDVYRSAREHVSFSPPAGWEQARALGSTILTSEHDGRKNTIVVRSVARDFDIGVPKEPAAIQALARTAIRGLPGAEFTSEAPVTAGKLAGTAIDLSFLPQGVGGPRYQRRHVVLVGDKRILHVMHTAPEGAIDRTRPEFDAVLNSLKEEV